jgi:hypothetical protein
MFYCIYGVFLLVGVSQNGDALKITVYGRLRLEMMSIKL